MSCSETLSVRWWLLLISHRSYTVDLKVAKGAFNFTLVDYLGKTFDTSDMGSGTIAFTLTDDWASVGVTGMTFDKDVEVSYKATQLFAGDVTATTPAPTRLSAGSRLGASGVSHAAIALAVFFGAMAWLM